jgi:hypothetical protein
VFRLLKGVLYRLSGGRKARWFRDYDCDSLDHAMQSVITGPSAVAAKSGNGPSRRGRHLSSLSSRPPMGRGMTVMTLRPPGEDGNTRDSKSGPGSHRVSLTLRDVVILSGGLVVGIVTGILTYLAGCNPPEAVLAGIPACAGAISFLDALID